MGFILPSTPMITNLFAVSCMSQKRVRKFPASSIVVLYDEILVLTAR